VTWNAAFSAARLGDKVTEAGGSQIQKDLGAAPIFFEPKNDIPSDNKTHVTYLYYTTCPACEEGKTLFISKSYPIWQGNLTFGEVAFGALNYYSKKDVGESYFSAFNISGTQKGASILVIHNSKVGVVYYPPFNDVRVQKAVYYLTKGSMVDIAPKKAEPKFSQPLVYALGAISGFNPCLIALASFFFATATKTSFKSVARRIGLISVGLIYAYLIFFSLIVSNPVVMSSLVSLTWLIAFILVIMGLLHFVEVGHDIYSRRWGGGSSIEAKLPLFKTPRQLKGLLEKTREMNSPAYDFVLGAIFSLIKLPCIAAFLVVLLVNSTTPLTDITIFTLGVATPIILMGALIGLGMIKVNRLNTAQFKGRIIQRLIIGAALILSAILVIP
jgi:cytochrome c biogenesis protein CcdA